MTVQLAEALAVTAAGIAAVAFAIWTTPGLRVACGVGGLVSCLVGLLLLIHAGA